jgi:cell wall-associated NlpC family hydrolase
MPEGLEAQRRQQLIDWAKAEIGSHYLWGAAGNTPGNSDGAFYRPNQVHLHENDTEPAPKGCDYGRTQDILFAATCFVDGNCVCAGRDEHSEVRSLPRADVEKLGQLDPKAASKYRWPRPYPHIESPSDKKHPKKHTKWGESCVGIRHFDCIGFVNWCLAKVGAPHQRSIAQWIHNTHEVSFDDLWPGDILTHDEPGHHHIGIASGRGIVIHAWCAAQGVVETAIQGKGFTRAGRLPPGFWGVF